MKTMKRKQEIKRVSDAQAEKMTKDGWVFCPKKEWKDRIKKTTEQVTQILNAWVAEWQTQRTQKGRYSGNIVVVRCQIRWTGSND